MLNHCPAEPLPEREPEREPDLLDSLGFAYHEPSPAPHEVPYRPTGPRARGLHHKTRLGGRLPLAVSASTGLEPQEHLFTLQHEPPHGIRIRTRKSFLSVRIGDDSRSRKWWQEKYRRIEHAVNQGLAPDQRLRFDRETDGSYAGWGSHPVQATGTIGLRRAPFEFRFRFNHAHLTISTPDEHDPLGKPMPVSTAGMDDFYPGHPDAGDFASEADVVRCLRTLLAQQGEIDFWENPTRHQHVARELAFHLLTHVSCHQHRHLDLEEQFLIEHEGSEAFDAIRQRWLESPEVVRWVEDGRSEETSMVDWEAQDFLHKE